MIHITCNRIIDQDDLLRSIGRMDFTVAPGRATGPETAAAPIRATDVETRGAQSMFPAAGYSRF